MKPGTNRFTIGKYLRKAKGLRKRDPTAHLIDPPKELQLYIDDLKSKGVQIKDLAVAEFRTRNGLPYIGLVATQLFPSNKIFIRVPVDCLLNTRKAFHSPLKKFFEENPQYFSKELHSNWEDHILLAYLLYEFGQGEKSEWKHLIANLPREIDYIAFWKEEEFGMLEDPIIVKMAHAERLKYENETKELLQIASRYPDLFPAKLLQEENIRWIHIHLVTRCFGKYFEYTTMVPFAELLNHECSDVYYTMFYKEDNPNTQGQEFYEEKVLTPQQLDDLDSSDGTYNSEQYDDDENNWAQVDLKQAEVESQPQTQPAEEDQIIKSIRDTRNQLYNCVNFGDNVSLGFLLETYEALETLRTAKVSPSLKKIEISRIQGSNSIYINLAKWFHSRAKTNAYTSVFTQRKAKEQQPQRIVLPDKQYYPEEWSTDKFDEFLMLCSTKDQFEAGSQVFFCYGRLSNRLLLMRYGIAIEHNKYNHLFLRLDMKEYSKGYTAYPQVLHDLKLSRMVKIKVKRTKMCVELLAFLRGLKWKLHDNVEGIFYVLKVTREMEVLRQAIQIYERELGRFGRRLEQNQKLLEDPKLGYHEYFATVYRLEKQRILAQQVRLARVAIAILQRMSEKQLELPAAMLRVHELEDAEQMQRHRLMMRNYFDVFFK